MIRRFNEKSISYESLARRNDELERKVEELEQELAEVRERLKRTGRHWGQSMRASCYRAKQMEAIRMILDGEWELNTNHDEPEIVKAEKPNPISARRPFSRRV